MLQKKGHSFVPHTPRLGATDAAKKRAAFRSPTAPLGGGLRGARLRRRPIPWTPPRCLTDRRELHRWLAVTDNPPIKPCISRAPPPLAGPPHRNQSLPPQARFLDSDPGSACPTAKNRSPNQTGRNPGCTRCREKEVKCALFGPGSKPGEPRDQTGRAPDSNRASPGIKPGEPRDQTRRAPGKGLSNLSKVSNAGGREKSVKSVSFVRFALSVEGVLSGEGRHPSLQVVYDFVVHYKLGRTGSNRAPPEKDCQICQKCQTPGGEKRASKASVLSGSLSLWRVFPASVLCQPQASFRDIGQNSALRRPADCRAWTCQGAQSLGLRSACKLGARWLRSRSRSL